MDAFYELMLYLLWGEEGGGEKKLHQQPQKKKLSFFVAVGAIFFHRPLGEVDVKGKKAELTERFV